MQQPVAPQPLVGDENANVYGDVVVPPEYDSSSAFWNGMAEVIQYPKSEGDPEVHIIITMQEFQFRWKIDNLMKKLSFGVRKGRELAS